MKSWSFILVPALSDGVSALVQSPIPLSRSVPVPGSRLGAGLAGLRHPRALGRARLSSARRWVVPAPQRRAVDSVPYQSPWLAFESQRDSVLQPRVAPRALPWVRNGIDHNPNGVAARLPTPAATPLGLAMKWPVTQGSSFLATLGWRPQSHWDWPMETMVSFTTNYSPRPYRTASSRRRLRGFPTNHLSLITNYSPSPTNSSPLTPNPHSHAYH